MKRPSAKRQTLKTNGTLHPHPEQVHDSLFYTEEFFDANDLLQVKYEMLRRVRSDGWSVTQAVETFGFSRPSFYKAQSAFDEAGLAGLVGRKRGPKAAHKLSAEVMAFVTQQRTEHPNITLRELAEQISKRFAISVHIRSLQRALRRQEKKRRKTA